MANPEIPAGIAQIRSRVNGAETIIGSGMVVGVRHVLTAHHVIKHRDSSELHVRVANLAIAVQEIVEPIGGHADHFSDVALLVLESDLPSEQIVTALRDAKWYLSRWQQRNTQAVFYGWPLDEALPQAHPVRVLGGMTRLSEPDALSDLQVQGGVLEGFSGGPVMVHIGRNAFVIGLARLGGEKSASSRLIGCDAFLGFLSEHGVQAQTVSAKDIYSVVGWLPIADPIATLKQEKIAELLTWTGRLTELVGRPLQPLIDWAEHALEQEKVCCKVIVGEGGLGKTRYAFEGADRLSKAGWQIVLIQSKTDLATFSLDLAESPDPLSNKGLVMIDYAETFRSQLGDLLTSIQKSSHRMAVLLLSRHGQEYWNQADRLPNAGLCEITFELFTPLSPEDSFVILQKVLTRLEVNLDSVPRQTYLDWLNPQDNPIATRQRREFLRYPLLILGVGLCLKLDPGARFQELTHHSVIDSLVKRETQRFSALEAAAGFPKEHQGLSLNLQLLAILTNALDYDLLQHLASDPSLSIGFAGPHAWEAQLDERGIDCLRGGSIQALTPDLFAAGFAYSVLETLNRKNPQRVPGWLAAIADHLDNLDGFLGQFILRWHDLWTLGYGNAKDHLNLKQIEQWLVALFPDHSLRCQKAQNFFSGDTCLMPRVGAVVWAKIVAGLEESAKQDFAAFAPDLASSLNNWSNRLAESGDRSTALVAIQRAVKIYEDLAQQNFAAYAPSLALSLNNWSNCLAKSGDRPAALVAIQRAVKIYDDLAQQNFAAYTPSLAMSLHNLSSRLAGSGDRPGALAAIQRAVEIHETLAQQNFAAFASKLASSLNNWSVHLAESGDRLAALAAIQRAVKIDEDLAQQNFAAYAPNLASSLHNWSKYLVESDDHAAALAAIQRALETYEILAQQNFAIYAPDLASSLIIWSIVLAESGDHAAAPAAIQRAVEIYEDLAQQNFAAYAPSLAMSLNNWSAHLAESGDRPGALTAIQRAVEIRETLAQRNFAAFAPKLASSLNNWSVHLAESGDRPAALAAIQRAVKIDEDLAQQNYAAYAPGLAGSLATWSNRLAESGDHAAALAAIQRVVKIYEDLAQQNFAGYGPDLAMSLNNWSILLAESGDHAAASVVSQRAVEIRDALSANE